MRHRFRLAVFAAIAVAIAPGASAAGSAAGGRTFRAVGAFTPAADAAFAPYYEQKASAKPEEHGVAIDTVRHAGRPAAADLIYAGPAGRFVLELTAVAEEDGESTYRIELAGRGLETRRNPPVTEKRVPVPHRWGPVDLQPGDRIRVVFAGATNGKIPEGNGTAWARGRWRALTLIPAPAADR